MLIKLHGGSGMDELMDWLPNVAFNDISVIYVTAYIAAVIVC